MAQLTELQVAVLAAIAKLIDEHDQRHITRAGFEKVCDINPRSPRPRCTTCGATAGSRATPCRPSTTVTLAPAVLTPEARRALEQ